MYENKEEYPEWYLICLLFTSHTVSRCRTFDARVFPKNKKNYPQNTRVRQTLMSKSSRPPMQRTLLGNTDPVQTQMYS